MVTRTDIWILRKKGTEMVSIKSIYNYVNNMENLKKNLRHNKPYKRKYGSGTNRPDTIKDRVSIDKDLLL